MTRKDGRRLVGSWTAVLLLMPAAYLTGCDCGGQNLTKGKPAIQANPTALHFGAQNIGVQTILSVSIENIGDAPLSIQSITLAGDDPFSLQSWDGLNFADATFPDGIAAPTGSNPSGKDLRIGFVPQETNTFTAEVVIQSNARNAPQLNLAVDGSGSVPGITVSPILLDFGDVGLNSSSSLDLTVGNRGEADLIIAQNGLSLKSGSSTAPFHWAALTQDLILHQGDQKVIEVIYSPTEVRVDPLTHQALPDEDVLEIASNDLANDPVGVPLRGKVSANLPPVAGVSITQVTKIDGSTVADPCAMAPSDTITLEGKVLDPEGSTIQPSNLIWKVEKKPSGSFRDVVVQPDPFHPTFKADLSGDYTICLKASDPQGNIGKYNADSACSCPVANADQNYQCPCVSFSALPREDIRIELTWDFLGPDLDLHLVAPNGTFCSPTRDCRYDPQNPQNPNWDRTACVVAGTMTTCRTPGCDPVANGCQSEQECFDPGTGPACWWKTCSGTDCFWNARNPDWGVLGDPSDDPLSAIDCTHGCRAENINLNNPAPGLYTIMVNYYQPSEGTANATVRIFFKGDLTPTAEYTSPMTEPCDTWSVALIDWTDHDNHPVTFLGNAHTSKCCN